MDTKFVLEALDEALEVSQIRRRFISRNTLLWWLRLPQAASRAR